MYKAGSQPLFMTQMTDTHTENWGPWAENFVPLVDPQQQQHYFTTCWSDLLAISQCRSLLTCVCVYVCVGYDGPSFSCGILSPPLTPPSTIISPSPIFRCSTLSES